MGKGDQRTEKGKRVRGTFGNSRPKKGKGKTAKPAAPKKK
jgi:ribosomal small subunit protein bTHX